MSDDAFLDAFIASVRNDPDTVGLLLYGCPQPYVERPTRFTSKGARQRCARQRLIRQRSDSPPTA